MKNKNANINDSINFIDPYGNMALPYAMLAGCIIGAGGSLVKDWIDAIDQEKWDDWKCIACKALCYCDVGMIVPAIEAILARVLTGIGGIGSCYYYCKHIACCNT
jgi:hypothetical protein